MASDSGFCSSRSVYGEDPTEADCLYWFSRGGLCLKHMSMDGNYCDDGEHHVALPRDEGLCTCVDKCDVKTNSSSGTRGGESQSELYVFC